MGMATELEPNLEKYSITEILAMGTAAADLYAQGDKEEADKIIKKIPLYWKTADMLKDAYGIKVLIENGMNLSGAVEHYGRQWLEC